MLEMFHPELEVQPVKSTLKVLKGGSFLLVESNV